MKNSICFWMSLVGFAGSLSKGAARDLSTQSHNPRTVDSRPVKLNADARETYDHNFMPLMKSPCRPEPDGFFGATSGDPVMINYGFRLEVQPLSSTSNILDIIQEHLVDDILSISFPKECGFRRDRNLAHSSLGFRFYEFLEIENCDPTSGELNFCGYFSGRLDIYSREINEEVVKSALNILRQSLSPSSASKVHPEIGILVFENKYLDISGDFDIEEEKEEGLSDRQVQILTWGGLGFVGVLLCTALWWVCIRPGKESDTGLVNGDRGKGYAWSRWFRGRGGLQNNYDPEEKSIGPRFENEAVALRDQQRFFSTGGGRPLFIDHQSSTNSYDDEIDVPGPLL